MTSVNPTRTVWNIGSIVGEKMMKDQSHHKQTVDDSRILIRKPPWFTTALNNLQNRILNNAIGEINNLGIKDTDPCIFCSETERIFTSLEPVAKLKQFLFPELPKNIVRIVTFPQPHQQ